MCRRCTGALTDRVGITLVVPESILGVSASHWCARFLARVLTGLKAVVVVEMLIEVGVVE